MAMNYANTDSMKDDFQLDSSASKNYEYEHFRNRAPMPNCLVNRCSSSLSTGYVPSDVKELVSDHDIIYSANILFQDKYL